MNRLFLGFVDESRHFLVHPADCTKYIEVVPGTKGAVTFVKSCSFGLFWDAMSLACVNSTHTDCSNGKPTIISMHHKSTRESIYYFYNFCLKSAECMHVINTGI